LTWWRTLVALAAAFGLVAAPGWLLAGCGQKGPLFLPPAAKAASAPPSTQAAASAAAPADTPVAR
jgi:predicted small lipoprotein YifL